MGYWESIGLAGLGGAPISLTARSLLGVTIYPQKAKLSLFILFTDQLSVLAGVVVRLSTHSLREWETPLITVNP